MIRAFEAGLLLAITAPIIGVFLVVRRYSLLSDTLSHVSLLGVSIGFLLKINPIITAIIATLIGAISIERLRQKYRIFGESLLAVFLSGSLAIAVVLLGIAKGFNVNVLNFLFGSLSTTQSSDVLSIGFLSLITIIFCAAFYKQLFLISLDEDLARVGGISVNALNNALVILAACTVALSIQIVGALLIGALMVMPVLSAMQVAESFSGIFFFALFFSITSVISGLFVSYFFGIASGGAIVIIALCFFLLSLFFARKK